MEPNQSRRAASRGGRTYFHPALGAVVLGVALLAVGVALLAPGEVEAPRRPSDVRASVFARGSQLDVVLTAAPGGGSVIAWESTRQEAGTSGVYARAFDAAGRPVSAEVRINQTVGGSQRRPAVAARRAGGAWFVWESADAAGTSVVARRFGAELGASGPELRLSSSPAVEPADPAIAAAGDLALAVWSERAGSRAHGRPARAIRARPLGGPDGAASASVISEPALGSDGVPAIAASGGGRFIAVWARDHGEAERAGIVGRLVDERGRPVGPELALATGRGAIEPAVDAAPDGRFVVAWLEPAAGGWAVAMRRFSPDGRPAGPPAIVARPQEGWLSGAAVAAAPDGGFAVAWNRDRHEAGEDVEMLAFDAAGRPRGSVLAATSAQAGPQRLAAARGARRLAWTADGDLALAWSGDGGDGDDSAAHLTLHRGAGREPVAPSIAAAARTGTGTAAAQIGSAAFAVPIFDPNARRASRRPAAVSAGGDFGFEAIPFSGWTPPDPESAVGPDRVMVIGNGAIAAFDRLGNLQWEDEIENTFGFWGELGADNFVFDPEIAWDPHAGRFWAMACERSDNSRSFFLLAVSRDASPGDRTDWHKWRIDVTALADNDIDSPNLALSSDFVLLSADFFGPDKYLLYILQKAPLLSGGAPIATSELITGAQQQSMGIPVVTSDEATLYILQSTENPTNDTVIIHAITDPFTDYQRQTFTLEVPPYTFPTPPPQKGTSVRPTLFEPRFWSVAEANGSLWAVHHVNSTRTRVRWYEIDLSGWPDAGAPQLAQDGELDLGDGIFTYFPSIDVDQLGNAAITFARSAANEYISMGRALRSASDPPGTFRPVQVAQASTNPYTTNRWGDYSGTQADPLEADTFWGHHEFSDTGGGTWTTWAARYELRPAPLVLTIEPFVAGESTTLSVSGATPGESVAFIRSVTGTGITEVAAIDAIISLEQPRLLGRVEADGAGEATLTIQVPPGAAGKTVWLQAAERGYTSNWIEELVE
jgi:hypothetical protein